MDVGSECGVFLCRRYTRITDDLGEIGAFIELGRMDSVFMFEIYKISITLVPARIGT